jgi:hypothetical protein
LSMNHFSNDWAGERRKTFSEKFYDRKHLLR